MEILEDELDTLFQGHSSEINALKPAKIIKVHSQYLVDIEYYENNSADVLYNVPVKHMQTNNAFIFLKLKVGDRGTVHFFDNDVDLYMSNKTENSTELRKHDINDNCFQYGFVPSNEQYVIPDCEICIGLKSQNAIIEFSENGDIKLKAEKITLTSNNIELTGSNIMIGSKTTIDGKSFLEHTHSNGNEGSPTGGVL